MNEEFRSVVHFCWLRKLNATDTFAQMTEAYGPQCPTQRFIYKWMREFDNGRQTVSDLPRCGRPLCLEKVEAVRDFILDCPSASCRCIAFVIGIDKNTVKKY